MADVKHWDLFPTKVFETKFVAKNDLINYIYSDQFKNHEASFTHQSVNNNLQKVNEFKPFVKKVHTLTKEMCKIYQYEYKKIDITSMWVNISQQGQVHPPHTHSNNVFSGVYYLESGAPIQFFDPRPQANILQPNLEYTTFDNSSMMQFNSQKGIGLIFPSWLQHWVPETKDERVSIAWNVIVRGKYGEPNTLQNATI